MFRYKLLGESDLVSLKNLFRTNVEKWKSKWIGLHSNSIEFECVSIYGLSIEDQANIYRFSFSDKSILFVCDDEQIGAIAGCLLDISEDNKQIFELGNNRFARLVVLRAIAEYLESIAGGACIDSGKCEFDNTVAEIRKGSGYAEIRMRIDHVSLRFVLDTSGLIEKAEAQMSDRERLAKFDCSMLTDKEVEVNASLVSSNIKLVDLMSLEKGDVIILDHKLKQPLELTFDGQKIANGELGRLEAHRCIKFKT